MTFELHPSIGRNRNGILRQRATSQQNRGTSRIRDLKFGRAPLVRSTCPLIHINAADVPPAQAPLWQQRIGAQGLEEMAALPDAISYFPARPLTPVEHALLAEWLAVAGDVVVAYVSSRRGDDPAYYRRIVVVTNCDEGPSHLVHAPSGRDFWLVFSFHEEPRIRSFPTLRAALNSIRPVFLDDVSSSPRRRSLRGRPPTGATKLM